MNPSKNIQATDNVGRPYVLSLFALIALAFFFGGHAPAQSEIVVTFTNHVWRYNQTGTNLAGTGWELPQYDDSSWTVGRGIFAFETSSNSFLTQYVYPFTNTVLALTYPGNAQQTVTYYFRTRFQNSGDPEKIMVTLSNLVDDGCVAYLNGVEVFRYHMPPGTPTGNTLANNSAVAEATSFIIADLGYSLVAGENVLAVEVHQNSLTSADVVWGCALHVAVAYPPILVQQPASINVLQGRSATLQVVAEGGPPPTYQWFRNFEFIPHATNNTFTITNMKTSDEGAYYVSVANPYGYVESQPVQVTMVPAPHILISLTNHVWHYNEMGTDLAGSAWEMPDYDDTSWPSGLSLLGRETFPLIAPLIRTPLQLTYPGQPNQTITFYFRTHFQFDGDPDQTVLVASNLIDDGYVMYLNGAEVSRFNMPTGAVDGSTLARLANPAGEGVYVTRHLPVGVLRRGDNVLAVEVHQNTFTSGDVLWGTVLHAAPVVAPRFLWPMADQSFEVMEGRSTNLTVVVEANPPATFQWFFNGAPLLGETSSVLRIINMAQEADGIYHCEAANFAGSAISAAFDVRYAHDDIWVNLIDAVVDPFDLARVTLSFDESVTGALDPFYYLIDELFGTGGAAVTDVAYIGSSNQVILLLDAPLDPLRRYTVTIDADIQDHYGNPLGNRQVSIVRPAAFRQDHDGYFGTFDTELHSGSSADLFMGDNESITPDLDDAGVAQGLLRFDDLFGGASNQIPQCASIISAMLRLYTLDPGSSVRMLRVNRPWNELSTWNSLNEGIDQTNGVETTVTDAILDVRQDDAFVEVDVTQAIQDAANLRLSFGWAFLSTGTDGWTFATSEHTNAAIRPALTIHFAVADAPCSIVSQPQSTNVAEGQAFTLAILASGSRLLYQWYKNGNPIPNATNDIYHISQAALSDEGVYHAEISSPCSGLCVSDNALVNVRCPPDLAITYNSDRTVSVSRSLCAGYLFQSESLAGPWTLIGTQTNRVIMPASGVARFFKLVP